MKPTQYRRLRQEHRDIICRLRKQGMSQSGIADVVGFNQSTISREITRNSGARGYRPKQAGVRAESRKATQRRPAKIRGEVAVAVEASLRRRHSPEQITGFYRRTGFDIPCHETIYRYVARDKAAGGKLYTYLRITAKRRYRRRVKGQRSKIVGRIGLEERPASVDQRLYFGDWEADLVEGSKGTGYVLTLVDRKSRYTLFSKLPDKTKATVSEAIVLKLRGMKTRTLTFDNGLEFSGHLEVARELGAKSYFCAPYHSWEKGLVENHNGLLRQYYKKGSSFEQVSEMGLQEVEDEINQRPRKTLAFFAPIDYRINLIAA
jgi:IS30 family transposase